MVRILGIAWLAVGGLGSVPPEQLSSPAVPTISEVARSIAPLGVAPAALTTGILAEDDASAPIRTPFVLPGQFLDRDAPEYQLAQASFAQAPADHVQASLGSDWVLAYGWLTSRERVRFELANTKLRVLTPCMHGVECNMDYQVGATLAAALRDIYKIYFPFSQPLPADLVEALRGVVPDNTLAVARWAVAPAPELNIPGFLGSSHSAGRTRAVTVGDLMIFPRMPQLLDRADVEWLLHELRHVEQHRTLTQVILESVDALSVQYVRQSEALEQDAVEVAAERTRELR